MTDACFLVVDGDSAFRSLTRDLILSYLHGLSMDAKFFEADSGDEALTIFDLNRNDIALILSGLNINGMTGIELLKKLRAIDGQVPFILLPERAEEKHIIAARDAGVTACVVKPFSPAELQSKLARVLGLNKQKADKAQPDKAGPDDTTTEHRATGDH